LYADEEVSVKLPFSDDDEDEIKLVEGVADNAGDNTLFLDVKLAVAVLAVNDIFRVNVTVAVAALEAFVVVFVAGGLSEVRDTVVKVPVVFVAAVIVMIAVAVVFSFDVASISSFRQKYWQTICGLI
jgi:hypothetical protein